LISKFVFGPEKLAGLSRNWPQYCILRVYNRFGGKQDFFVVIYLGCELKTGVGSRNFSNKWEWNLHYSWVWDALILGEK